MQLRDGVFVTNGKGALTCMRRDTTSSPFASSNRWDGPGAFRVKRPPRSVLVQVIREIRPGRECPPFCALEWFSVCGNLRVGQNNSSWQRAELSHTVHTATGAAESPGPLPVSGCS